MGITEGIERETLQRVAEVTRPDGSRFVSLSTVDARLIYRAEDGYSVRMVSGYPTMYGFRITDPA